MFDTHSSRIRGMQCPGFRHLPSRETVRRAGISVGPEYGTVSADFVREASKEAANDFDLLVICGMAFDARVGEVGTKLGRITVLRARMNPDLSMGGDLLKKTASANLFTARSAARRRHIRQADGDKIVVEVRGSTSSTRPQVRSAAIQLTTSLAGSSINTTTKRASSFVMPTSSAATILTRSSAARLRLTSTKPHGPRYTAPSADHLRCH